MSSIFILVHIIINLTGTARCSFKSQQYFHDEPSKRSICLVIKTPRFSHHSSELPSFLVTHCFDILFVVRAQNQPSQSLESDILYAVHAKKGLRTGLVFPAVTINAP